MENIFIKQKSNQFKSNIDSILEYVDYLEELSMRLENRLSTFKKDNEIQKYRDEMYKAMNLSLLMLSQKEKDDIKQFKQDHYKSCNNSGDFEYRITGTGIGSVIKIKCPKCMATKDVTDASTW